jgi:hypothetical protein
LRQVTISFKPIARYLEPNALAKVAGEKCGFGLDNCDALAEVQAAEPRQTILSQNQICLVSLPKITTFGMGRQHQLLDPKPRVVVHSLPHLTPMLFFLRTSLAPRAACQRHQN